MDNLPDCQYEYGYEAPIMQIAEECSICGHEIYEGDEYYHIDNLKICEDCILDFKKIGEI
ncbi:hypothetical protein DP145_01570 [Clostridium tetani]|uniref:Uncharacterized protein n=1 Tax=Clostridium tetani TaxID=1513 RepID=A0ABY0EMI7_CLOTA|nr:hypothetical protein [Clostridium tetani]YP_009218038.1 hypothetical protein phiCT19406C_09 [Clostridium phage phiCT19406C]AJA42832.1 hypothetical protein phiCT19406C_09 [Clostridium phage phiCT19406C]KGI44962.1 hypothetical protein KY54_06585 [Clostridium tetani]KHO32599.1 hypothetical protein OR63_06540 [Clostridium tetani]RXI46056.1 hypothetical protein DP126_07650 [Clostridium tetani]RXI52645.1 hypothetical protein DP131_12050 [Clostridium tetani]